MLNRYIHSEEEYRGYILKVVTVEFTVSGLMGTRYTRKCEAWKDGKHIATSKTKKEMKKQIAEGYIK